MKNVFNKKKVFICIIIELAFNKEKPILPWFEIRLFNKIKYSRRKAHLCNVDKPYLYTYSCFVI